MNFKDLLLSSSSDETLTISSDVNETMSQLEQLYNAAKSTISKIHEQRDQWEKKKKSLKAKEFRKDEMIELNIGGKTFTTTIETLTQRIIFNDEKKEEEKEIKDEDEDEEEEEERQKLAMKKLEEKKKLKEPHMFQVMFSGYFDIATDKDGKYFLDRDHKHFRYILNYLRAAGRIGEFTIPMNNEGLIRELCLEAQFYNIYPLVKYLSGDLDSGNLFAGTTVLKSKDMKLLNKWFGKKTQRWELLYKASKDGFASTTFHAKCDSKGPTMVIVKVKNGNIMGGFAAGSWNQGGTYQYNTKSFLFLLHSTTNKEPAMFPNTGLHAGGKYSTYGSATYGPTFGGGHDLYICNGSNVTASSYSNLGHSYTVTGETYGSTTIKTVLAGAYNFTTDEIEVFGMKSKKK